MSLHPAGNHVVTGASGLVGANLVRALLDAGLATRALVHRDRRALEGLPAEIARADLLDPDSLRRAFSGVEVVYHAAGFISLRMDTWDELARVNIDGTRHVIAACRAAGVRRLVYFSSVHTLEQHPFDRPLDEERPYIADPGAPPYERSKVEAEKLVRAAEGLETVVLLPSAVVGPHDWRPSYIGQAILQLAEGRIPALVHGGYDWVDARDVAEGAVRAAQRAAPGSRYILSGHWHSVREVAGMVAEISGRPAPRLAVPLGLAELAEPLMRGVARLNGTGPLYTRAMLHALRSNPRMSHARAARDLGYAPRPLQETLVETLTWFAEREGAH